MTGSLQCRKPRCVVWVYFTIDKSFCLSRRRSVYHLRIFWNFKLKNEVTGHPILKVKSSSLSWSLGTLTPFLDSLATKHQNDTITSKNLKSRDGLSLDPPNFREISLLWLVNLKFQRVHGGLPTLTPNKLKPRRYSWRPFLMRVCSYILVLWGSRMPSSKWEFSNALRPELRLYLT